MKHILQFHDPKLLENVKNNTDKQQEYQVGTDIPIDYQ